MSVASRHTDTAAADAAKLLVRFGLAILMIGLPSAAAVSLGAIYVLMPIGAALILIGQTLDLPMRGLRGFGTAIRSPLGLLTLFLLFWTGLSLIWTPFPAPAGERFLKIVGPTLLAVVVAAFLPPRPKPFELYVLPVGVAAAAVLTLVIGYLGRVSASGGFGVDEATTERSIVTLIVLVWPALGALSLREHWLASAILAVLVAVVAFYGSAQVALLAMGAGACTFAVAMSAPDRTARILTLGSVTLILLAPAFPFVYGFVPSLDEAPGQGISAIMQVWAGTISGHWPRLITGHGFDLANYGPSIGFLPVETPKTLLFVLWYDLGVVGAVTFAALTAGAFGLAAQAPPSLAPALLAGLVVVLVLAFTGLATAQVWWVTLVDCGIIAAALLVKGARRTQRPALDAITEPGAPAADG